MKITQAGIMNGLLGTIILHLLVGIIFFSAKLKTLYNDQVQVQVETPETVHQEELEQKQAQKKISVEQRADAFIASHRRSNIGVNVADKTHAATDNEMQQTEEDIEAAKKQIASIQANLDNQDKYIQSKTDQKPNISSEKKTVKIKGKLAVYKGPTNIYYDLPNRRDVYLYVPVYKCQGNGKVVVNIEVSPAGDVTDAIVDKQQSDNDDCLVEAAVDAARRSSFNATAQKQEGTITYLFVAQ